MRILFRQLHTEVMEEIKKTYTKLDEKYDNVYEQMLRNINIEITENTGLQACLSCWESFLYAQLLLQGKKTTNVRQHIVI